MGSTGEPERKRRHFGSISPTSAGATKKQPFSPRSEDKKVRSLRSISFFFLQFLFKTKFSNNGSISIVVFISD